MRSAFGPQVPRVALLASVALVAAETAGGQSTVPDAGPAVGSVAPAFEAVDHAGETRTFEDLAGPDGLLLLFFRSADW